MNQIMFQELVEGIKNIFNSEVVSIILYGSVARGDAGPESDIDVAIILKGGLPPDYEDKLSDFLVDMNLKYDKVFSAIDIDEERYIKWQDTSPFYKNVKKEGIILWKAA